MSMVLGWRIGKSAFAGDIQMFYNSVLLSEDFWKYQQIQIKENLEPDEPTITAVITTLIYGVRSVASQCEEVIKLLADKEKETHPEVVNLLSNGRYVDDVGGSTPDDMDTKKLQVDATNSLDSVSMTIKGWAISGIDPPGELSKDGVSVPYAGLQWYTKCDFYKLNIQSLHFRKRKRGGFPADLITRAQESVAALQQCCVES